MLAHHVEEGGTCVLDQVPTIGDLNRLRSTFCRCLAIAGTAVPRDNFDTGMIAKPCRGRFALAVGKKRHNTAPFKIADDGSVPATSAPCPIIYTHDTRGPNRRDGATTDAPQERVLADGNGESFGEIVSGASTEGQTEPIDDIFHASRSSREWNRDTFIKPLGKYRSWATPPRTPKTPDRDQYLNRTAMRRQISQ
jgi:hypothetical protein